MSRRSKIAYFPVEAGAPPPLLAEVHRRVRFEEVDPLAIVWHGRYASYFEDGREAFGDKYSLGYQDMRRENFMAPIVQLHIEYHRPLVFPDQFLITTWLHWTAAVRLNFSYRITGPRGEVVATGYSVQLIQNMDRQVLLVRPDYLERFWRRWQANDVQL